MRTHVLGQGQMKNKHHDGDVMQILLHSIEDAQETIRGYDNKAEVLGVLLTLSIGVTNFSLVNLGNTSCKYFMIASWCTALLAIIFLGLVLHPRSDLFEKIIFGGYTPKRTYYMGNINTSPTNTVSELASRIAETDWVHELTYEIMKLSLIRDYKKYWFEAALRTSGLALVMVVGVLTIGALQ